MSVSVVVPLFNEVENIPRLYEGLEGALGNGATDVEYILVNDGSRDGTGKLLDDLADSDGKVKVIHFPRNFGQTSALMAGINAAAGDTIVCIDGDLQNDPADINRLLTKLQSGYDVCSGWRKERKDNFFMRTLPSRVANKLISLFSGVHLHDYGCTLKAYRRDVLKGVKLYGEMHRFIPIYASWYGAKVTEIPVTHHPRKHGRSNYGLGRTAKVLLDLIVVQFLHRFSQNPMYVFGGVGLVCMAASVLCFLLMLYYKYFDNTSFIETPLPFIVTITFLMGFFTILMGLIAELLMRTYFESQNKLPYVVERTRNLTERKS